ncbi:MAG TPA: histidine kinase, partial [Actinomycetes bacterium]
LLAVFEDRDRIGRDLHDLVIQRLFAIGLTLENAARLSTRPEVAQRITDAVDDLDATIKDIRRTIFELSAPPSSTDIRTELRSALAVVAPALGFEPRLQTAGPVESVVPDQVRPHLLAVLREALSNVARHAGASSVDVRLEAGDTVVLTVVDDGKGIVLGDRESGLRNMRERAAGLGGTFDVRPGEGGGTTLVWEVPAR